MAAGTLVLPQCRSLVGRLARHAASCSSKMSPNSTWCSIKCTMHSLTARQSFPAQYEPVPLRVATRLREGKLGGDQGTRDTAVGSTIFDEFGEHNSAKLLARAVWLSQQLKAISPAIDKGQANVRIALLLPNDYRYVVGQWAVWICGACAVPLHRRLPPKLLEQHIQDSGSTLLITADELGPLLNEFDVESLRSIRVVSLSKDGVISNSDQVVDRRPTAAQLFKASACLKMAERFAQFRKWPAQMVYTSGTTGRPKGVVTTYTALHAQATSLAHDWVLTPEDHLLHYLPLHHTHGILNGLVAPLWAGSNIHMLTKFDPEKVWEVLLSEDNPVNVMLGVPTMYAHLVSFAKERLWERRDQIRDFLKLKLRLCTCGSAPLRVQLLREWEELTGHVMLERYGMTEFGMGLGGDPFDLSLRQPGTVGRPFSGLEVRVTELDAYVDTGYRTLAHVTKHSTMIDTKYTTARERIIGELLVKGPQMFCHYHKRPEETRQAFTKDGWFRTGDMAELVPCGDHNYVFKIIGRKSMDFIKCGGYKISAMEVQSVLDDSPGVMESAVFGVPDMTWGERVVAVVVPSDEKDENTLIDDIKTYCEDKLPPTSIPSTIVFVPELPRNVMGKIDKNVLREEHFPGSRKEAK